MPLPKKSLALYHNEIVELYEGGMSAKKLAKLFGCSSSHMGKYLKYNYKDSYIMRSERRAKMQRLYSEGYSVEEISTIVDRSISTVNAAVRFMPHPGDFE